MTTQLMSAPLSAEATATYLGISPRTLEGWRARGQGPRYIRLTATKGVRYRMEDIVASLRTRQVKP